MGTSGSKQSQGQGREQIDEIPMALPEKVGAGLLICCGGECLLLKRAPTGGNPNKMGLPGGNADPGDADLTATALREAEEEMGPLPPLTVRAPILTRRGKRGQKHYTVLVADVTPEVKAAWAPRLNYEHTAWEWVPLGTLGARGDLHPVVRLLLAQPQRGEVQAALGEGITL